MLSVLSVTKHPTKKKSDEGEIPQYYIENNHEVIIEPVVFDLVHHEIEKETLQIIVTRYFLTSITFYSGLASFYVT